MTPEQQIKAVAEAIRTASMRPRRFWDFKNKRISEKMKATLSVATSIKAAKVAIAAMPVREMTVDEVAACMARHEGYDPERMIYASLGAANVRRPTPIKERYYSVAQALAKLGAIRIVEK